LNNFCAGRNALTNVLASASGHSVIVAEGTFTVVTTRNNTVVFKPGPNESRLSSVAALREAFEEVTAGSGIGNREELMDTVGNAMSIIKSLSGTVGPA